LKIKTFVDQRQCSEDAGVDGADRDAGTEYLQLKSTFSWSLSTLAALCGNNCSFYRDLWVWLDDPFRLAGPVRWCMTMRNSLKSHGRRQFGGRWHRRAENLSEEAH